MPRGLDVDHAALVEFCRRRHVRRLSFFGSVLRDDFAPDSDVDILVEFHEGHEPGLDFFEMEAELSGIVGRRVDLHTPGSLSPRFRERVQASAETEYVEA